MRGWVGVSRLLYSFTPNSSQELYAKSYTGKLDATILWLILDVIPVRVLLYLLTILIIGTIVSLGVEFGKPRC